MLRNEDNAQERNALVCSDETNRVGGEAFRIANDHYAEAGKEAMSEMGFSDEEIEIIERLRAQAMTGAAKPLDAGELIVVGPCIPWLGSSTNQGYGTYSENGKTVYAHRLAYIKAKGPIPEGKQIDHLCRNRGCINPDHMEAVDSRTNTLRGNGASARQARKTHCVHGHPLSGEHLLIVKNGKHTARICRECSRYRDRSNRMARKLGYLGPERKRSK